LVHSAEIVDKVSEEIVNLSQAAHSKDSDALKNVSYEFAILITNNTKLVSDDGLPTSVPTSLAQCSKAERLLFHGVVIVSASSAKDPTLDMPTAPPAQATHGDYILSPIISPITCNVQF
jgi:hypothetical protein